MSGRRAARGAPRLGVRADVRGTRSGRAAAFSVRPDQQPLATGLSRAGSHFIGDKGDARTARRGRVSETEKNMQSRVNAVYSKI